jgi:hypothetical protein
MGSKQTLILGLLALVAGITWGQLRHRDQDHQRSYAVLQGLEWFVAVGGAAAAIELLRDALGDTDLEVTERLTHTRQTVTDRVGDVFSR